MDEGGRAGRDCRPRGARATGGSRASAHRPPLLIVVVVVMLTQRIHADCDRLPAVPHGNIEYTLSGTNQTTSAMITCQESYRLVGSDMRSCLHNDTWNGTQPSCQLVTCESLPTIPNGQVQHEGTTMYIGSVAKYKCIKRFRLVGVANRTCQADAAWSGEQPECVRIVCKHPGAPVNGKALPDDVTDYPAGTTIQYTCREGYNLDGPQSIDCSEEGIWTSEIPNCQITDCGRPPAIPHATANYTETDMGTNVTYTCSPGHEVTSQTVLRCMASGNWSGTIVPCIDVPSEADVGSGPEDETTTEGALVDTTTTVELFQVSMTESGVLTTGVLVGVGCGLVLAVICLTTVACLVRKRRCRGQYDVTLEDPIQPSYINRSTSMSGKRHLQGNGHVICAVGNGHDNHMATYCDGGCRSASNRGQPPLRTHDVIRDRNRNQETHLQMNSSVGGYPTSAAPPEPGGGHVYISDPRSNVDSSLELSRPTYYNRTAL